MAETASISSRVLDALVETGLITLEQLASIQEAADAEGASTARLILDRGLVTEADIGSVLEDEMGVPRVDLASYAPEDDALALLPASIARERRMLPLFEIEGMLTVAVGEPADVFGLDDVAAQTGLEIEPVLADPASVLEAVTQCYARAESEAEPAEREPAESEPAGGPEVTPVAEVLEAAGSEEAFSLEEEAPPPPPVAEAEGTEGGAPVFEAGELFEAPGEGEDEGDRVPAPPVAEDLTVPSVPPAVEPIEAPSAEVEGAAGISAETIEQVVEAAGPEGGPEVDLDVLAVADASKVAVLVSDILALAMRKGASHVHALPYKNDFFLVFRVGGRLEKIASAPLGMQAALVDGFKSYARVSGSPSGTPTLGRVHSRVGDKDLVLTISVVPTVAGQRMVVSLAPGAPVPRDLAALGMSEAEVRALHAMVERGRGLLLVCAPVAGGRSATYYALLAHAAAVGKTAYSVERSVDFEIPAVAQVLVNPGSPVGAASYFAAGMRQDTDAMAVDGLQSVEDIHLAVQAAGLGKLVIATVAAADVTSGVRRLLDLGAEPTSLAAALTLAVGQRLVRTNCERCAQEQRSDAAARIPGAPKGLKGMAGAGCDACAKTGFAGVTGIFEVLPFTEPVRARVAAGATHADLAAAAKAAGMRPLATSGLAKVEAGLVSPEELDRVLRFGE